MRLPENEWSNTNGARGVLFVAQALREMLTQQTFESFRAMSLDTMARLRECRRILADLERGAITEASVGPFLGELEWSLAADIVAQGLEPNLIALYQRRFKDKRSPASFEPVVNALISRLSPVYKATLEDRIIGEFQDGKRSVLKSLTSIYCSHLLNIGYTRPYLLDSVDRAFFSSPMRRAGASTLKSFFSKFTAEERKFRVFVLTQARFADPVKSIGAYVHEFASLPIQVRNAFSNHVVNADSRWVETQFPAMDEYAAAEITEYMLNSAQAINYLGPQIDGFTWSDERYVVGMRSAQGRMIMPPSASPIKHRRQQGNTGRSKKFSKTISNVLGQFDRFSTMRLLNSLNTSDISGRHVTAETRLISLWSSVEVLLSDPPKGTARIVHYEQTIIPCICLKYIRRTTSAVFDELRSIYKAKFVRIVRSEPDFPTADDHTRFAFIMLKEENQPIRDKLLNLCSKNPLALYRLYRVRKECSSPKSILDTVRNHESRVKWQIYRIYRARNTLVHAGLSPTYLHSLVLNIFDYYKSAVWTIIKHSRSRENALNLAEIVSDIGVCYEVYKNRLERMISEKSFNDDDINFIVHGRI